MKRITDSLKYSRAAQTLLSAALNPQRLRLFVALAICLVALCVPAVAQFSGGTRKLTQLQARKH